MNALLNLINEGYEILPQSGFERIFLAYNRKTGDKFYFDIRRKQSPTFRRITHEWEFGVDVPDYTGYYAPIVNGSPFLVFFETETPPELYWVPRETIGKRGRRWKDDEHFPNGIIFVKVSDTIKIIDGEPFIHNQITYKQSDQTGLDAWISDKK